MPGFEKFPCPFKRACDVMFGSNFQLRSNQFSVLDHRINNQPIKSHQLRPNTVFTRLRKPDRYISCGSDRWPHCGQPRAARLATVEAKLSENEIFNEHNTAIRDRFFSTCLRIHIPLQYEHKK